MKNLMRAFALIIALMHVTDMMAFEEHFPQYYVDTVKTLIRTSRWDAAKGLLDEGIQQYPDDPDINWLMGRYYYTHKKDYRNARYHLVHALQNDNSHVEARHVLINVEDETKNYSSAIGYCNELLEITPYEKTLWRRKIELYRKQGNDAMADQLLERLYKIYPEDSVVRRDVNYQLELGYVDLMRNGKLQDATAQLEKLVNNNPKNSQYYQDLISIYKRRGMYDAAIATATAGITQIGPDQQLVSQKAKLLAGSGRHQEALNFIAEMQHMGGARSLAGLKNEIMKDAALAARLHDPYEMTARVYATDKSEESLNYLLNTSFSRGYYDDATYYIGESMKRHGKTQKLLNMKYELEKKAGHEKQADALLEQLYQMDPKNEEVVDAYVQKLMRMANEEFLQQDWKSAASHLQQLIDMNVNDPETNYSAYKKLLTCYGKMQDYDTAKKIYSNVIDNDTDKQHVDVYTSLYVDGVLQYLRELSGDESWRALLNGSMDLLEMFPDNATALHYAINASDALHLYDDFDTYSNLGYEYYPGDTYFVSHKAMSLDRNKKYSEALEILNPAIKTLDYSPQMMSVYTDVSEHYALSLISQNKCDSAQIILDKALEYNPDSKSLKYTKGLAYEKDKDLKNAFLYQSKYADVSLTELPDFNNHMKGLQYRGAKDLVDVEYQRTIANAQGEYSRAQVRVASFASLAYTHNTLRNSYMAQINYKGVDGDIEEYTNEGRGGTGIQGIAQWEHKFSNSFSAYINAGLANRFFSKISANLSGSYEFKNDWTASLRLGYRRTANIYKFEESSTRLIKKSDDYNLFIVTPSLMKFWQDTYMTMAQLDLFYMDSELYYNVNGKAKMFFLSDAVSSIGVLAGIGSFPELNMFDMNLMHNVSHTNTMVGLDVQWLMLRNLSVELTGSWFTYYNPRLVKGEVASYYRNFYNLSLQLHIAL